MDETPAKITWRAPVPKTATRTALLLASCGLIFVILLLTFKLFLAVVVTATYALYLLPPYFIALSFAVDSTGVGWRKGLQKGSRPWVAFRLYRRYAEGLELSAFPRTAGTPPPRLNQYRAVFLPFGESDPAHLEAIVSRHLPLESATTERENAV